MSDLFLDFRPRFRRPSKPIAEQLKFYGDIQTFAFDFTSFSLALTRPDDHPLWGPYRSSEPGVFVSLSGRLALESRQWDRASKVPGEGGLACKAVFQEYLDRGEEALTRLNGNFAVLLYDEGKGQLFLALDRTGMFPCFAHGLDCPGAQLISSHPDFLAAVAGCSSRHDKISMAEFLMTGRVSFPYTYYSDIRALEFGSVHRFDLRGEAPRYTGGKKFFSFDYRLDPKAGEEEVAQALSKAFTSAMTKRTLPILGKTAVAMSGGLDSRALLCSVQDRSSLTTFCFFDEENTEYRIARAIAREAKVELVPLKRAFDHYGGAAEDGVRIFGGMGGLFNNHFLGFRETFQRMGIDNLITGFYCDYYFKGLALDRSKHPWTQLERFADYRHEWYRPCFFHNSPYRKGVELRLEALFPLALRQDRSEEARLRVAERRVFPLCYEPDNAETTIPQRVMPLFLPMADSDVMDVYITIPARYKLNHSMYSRMVALQCGRTISRIPNVNTGASVDASVFSIVAHKYLNALRNRFEKKVKPNIALSGSWPNWEYYVHHSEKIGEMWNRSPESARPLFRELLGVDPFERPLNSFRGAEVDFFSRLLTLKLWLEYRIQDGP